MSWPDDLWRDVDIRVVDQRIGAGIGGFDTVIRAYHRPTDRPEYWLRCHDCQGANSTTGKLPWT